MASRIQDGFSSAGSARAAARLEQTAALGEILIGESTLTLVRDAVVVESVEPLAVEEALRDAQKDGISSIVLAALMGHESSTITEPRYMHLFDRQRTDDAVRQAMASASTTR